MGPDKNLPSEEVVQDALQKTRKSFAYANFTTVIFTTARKSFAIMRLDWFQNIYHNCAIVTHGLVLSTHLFKY